jgi:hypothetical protein
MSSATGMTTPTTRRAPRFVAWVRAWRAGLIPYDDVIDEIEATEDHWVADAADPDQETPLREALAALSPLHPDEIRLVLPAPGDPRGLPGPGTPFTGRALVTGEGVLAGELGLVPEVRTHVSGSGDSFASVVWWSHSLPVAVPGGDFEASAAEAEAELSGALADATTALTHLDIARWRPELGAALADLRRHDDGSELPPVFNPRARRLYARANLLDRVLVLAGQAAPGGAINAFEAQQRDAALRPLTAACRRALVAACNAPLV